jgi:DNA-binding NarL/FixJ family response regulator
MRIILADDHVLVRSGIRSLLEKIPRVEVVGEADNGVQALELVEALRPDVLLADIAMRELNGLQTAASVAKNFPDVKVIILSMHKNEEYVIQALGAGCVGYLLKDSAAIELDLALDAVGRGETYLSPSISRTVIDGYLSRVAGGYRTPLDPLTPRQLEVLKLVAEGKSTKQVAAALGVSAKTAEAHRGAIMRRLGIHDVAGLVKYALRQGVTSQEE